MQQSNPSPRAAWPRTAATALVLALSLGLAACSSPEEKVASFAKKGQSYLEQSDLVKARLEFQNALQIAPNNVPSLYGMALIAEVWPAHKRNRASAWVGIGWQLGVLLAAFITPLLLDIIGWRGMFLVGLLPALVSFAIRRGMGEPDAFTKDIAVTQEVSFTARLRMLFADRATSKAKSAPMEWP